MNKSLRAILSLSWQSVAYGVGTLGSQLIIYIMLPFLTHYMRREEYGVVSVMTAVYSFLNMLTNAGLPAAIFRYYNDTQDEKDRRLTLGVSQFLFLLFAVIPAVVILIFPNWVSLLLFDSEQYIQALQFLAGYLIIDSMNTYGYIMLRLQVRPLVSSLHSIFLITCNTSLALLFVVKFAMGISGYWLGYLIGESIGLIIMIWLIRNNIVFQVSRKRIGDLIKFGFPLIPAAISMIFLRVADRYIIGSLAGLEQVAIYDVGYKVGSVILLLITPFRAAWQPFALSMANKPEAPRIYKDVLTYITAGCSFLVLGVLAFRNQLIQLLAPVSYQDAAVVIGWVAVSQIFFAAYLVLSIGPMIAKQTHLLAWITVPASGVNLLLNFILIPSMGILGAAIATFAGYALLAILTYFIGKRSFDVRIDWPRMVKLVLVSGVTGSIIMITEQFSVGLWKEIVIKVFGLILFPALLLLIRFVNPAEAKDFFSIGKNLVKKRIHTNVNGSNNNSSS